MTPVPVFQKNTVSVWFQCLLKNKKIKLWVPDNFDIGSCHKHIPNCINPSSVKVYNNYSLVINEKLFYNILLSIVNIYEIYRVILFKIRKLVTKILFSINRTFRFRIVCHNNTIMGRVFILLSPSLYFEYNIILIPIMIYTRETLPICDKYTTHKYFEGLTILNRNPFRAQNLCSSRYKYYDNGYLQFSYK